LQDRRPLYSTWEIDLLVIEILLVIGGFIGTALFPTAATKEGRTWGAATAQLCTTLGICFMANWLSKAVERSRH
jgi:hypothetical protein